MNANLMNDMLLIGNLASDKRSPRCSIHNSQTNNFFVHAHHLGMSSSSKVEAFVLEEREDVKPIKLLRINMKTRSERRRRQGHFAVKRRQKQAKSN